MNSSTKSYVNASISQTNSQNKNSSQNTNSRQTVLIVGGCGAAIPGCYISGTGCINCNGVIENCSWNVTCDGSNCENTTLTCTGYPSCYGTCYYNDCLGTISTNSASIQPCSQYCPCTVCNQT